MIAFSITSNLDLDFSPLIFLAVISWSNFSCFSLIYSSNLLIAFSKSSNLPLSLLCASCKSLSFLLFCSQGLHLSASYFKESTLSFASFSILFTMFSTLFTTSLIFPSIYWSFLERLSILEFA